MRRPLVAGNWKMNGTRASVDSLLSALGQQALPEIVEMAVFPSFVHLPQVIARLDGERIAVGAQDCASDPAFGAMTGEVSASQIADLQCDYVLIGHSERRIALNESDEVVAAKFAAALSVGLKPVLCVGESLADREAGRAREVIERQLAAVMQVSGVKCFERAVVAYEPVWAIGTGLSATPEQAQEVHAAIREVIARDDAVVADGLRILYGGSVKSENAAQLFAMADVDGGLIGGASLNADEFGAICRAAGN